VFWLYAFLFYFCTFLVFLSFPPSLKTECALILIVITKIIKDSNENDIVADEALSPAATECNNQNLTPFSQHQLNAAKKQDKDNVHECL
jgi:hypothetical protein